MYRSTLLVLAVAAGLAGCAMGGHRHGDGPTARAALESTRGHTASGWVMFHQQGADLFVHARVSGLKPNQEHGFHIHEKGDCASGDGLGTGGHFNPTAKPHGRPGVDHHAGDLPALKADADGRVDAKFIAKGLTIGSGATDVVGRGVIIHALPDDYATQPTGNSGARIACAAVARLR